MQAVSGKSMNTDKILQLIHAYSFSPSPPVSQIAFFFYFSLSFLIRGSQTLFIHVPHLLDFTALSLISLSQEPEVILGGLILHACQ